MVYGFDSRRRYEDDGPRNSCCSAVRYVRPGSIGPLAGRDKRNDITMKLLYAPLLALACAAAPCTPTASAQAPATERVDTVWLTMPDSIELGEVVLRERRQTRLRPSFTTENVEVISRGEIVRAACCNLGESFAANPSVDVSYADAATGAQQIALLGLSGTYVQMLAENVPALRGAALPLGLAFVPGPWMESIQVSKGAASVKNGYESVTGQINVEYFKPQGIDGLRLEAFMDMDMMLQADAVGTVHLSDALSTGLMAHYETSEKAHDHDGDTFTDMPRIDQLNLMNRWTWMHGPLLSQLSLSGLHEARRAGQMAGHDGHSHGGDAAPPAPAGGEDLYRIAMQTDRLEATWKNALITRPDRSESVALILNGSWHDADNRFGARTLGVTQRSGYAQLLFETDLGERHNLAVGLSLRGDNYRNAYVPGAAADTTWSLRETTGGAYAQYTYKLGERLTAMAGLRADRSSTHGTFLTPRLHLKYAPVRALTLRASAGKGYRSPHALAEQVTLLAAPGRIAVLTPDGRKREHQEEAWNTGASAALTLPLFGRNLALNFEYYYTRFLHQTVTDLDRPDQGVLYYDLADVSGGRSYSHVVQVDATYPLFEGMSLTAAWRYQDARQTTGIDATAVGTDGRWRGAALRSRPLQSRYKALVTASYKTPLELWQLDATWHLNGPGRLPVPPDVTASAVRYNTAHTAPDGRRLAWQPRFHAFSQLSAQVTREFRHFAVYVGGENLTDFTQAHPVVVAADPATGRTAYDPTKVWGPTDGIMGYVGVRFNLEK